MGIFFSPVVGAKLTAWRFGDDILTGPVWKDDRPTYYIFYSHGLAPTAWQFWIELSVSGMPRIFNYLFLFSALLGSAAKAIFSSKFRYVVSSQVHEIDSR